MRASTSPPAVAPAILQDPFAPIEALETNWIATGSQLAFARFVPDIESIRTRRIQANGEFIARRYQNAVDQFSSVLSDAVKLYTFIPDALTFPHPNDFDKVTQLYQVIIPTRIAECYQGIGDYSTSETTISETLQTTDFTLLADPIARYIWLTAATLFLRSGDWLFRNDDPQSAVIDYTNVIAIDRTTPSSFLYTIGGLQTAADMARKVISAIDDFIGAKTTAATLGVDPGIAAVIIEISERLTKIEVGLDFWGHYHNTVPIWTFDYLQAAAINFTQFAISAERDFINFQDRNDQGTATRQQLVQLASQATAEIDAAKAQAAAVAAEAKAYADGVDLAQKRAADAIVNLIAYGQASALSAGYQALQVAASGGDSTDVETISDNAAFLQANGYLFGIKKPGDPGAAPAGTLAGAASLVASQVTQQYEVGSLRRTSEEMDVAAEQARQESVAAQARVAAANAATAVAALHAEAAQQNLQAFDSQTFTPDVWQRMADSMWRLYRRYLDMALKTALLMQQAYNFETDQSLRFIKNDYSTDEVKGLLGAEALMADIQSFTYDLITSTTGKAQPVRQTISLAQRYAYLFETQFRRTGEMDFETRIDDFDYVYPGTYAGRLEGVEVELVGLVPPSGVSGSLTNSGISGYRTPAGVSASASSGLKYRVQPRETLVISDFSARNDIALISPDARQRRIFEGAGLVSSWRLELPREINDIDYAALLDVRLTFLYKARYDPDLHQQVIAELESRPDIHARQRGIPLRWIYPDAFFRFQDTGILAFSQKAQDFASNETNPVITSVGVLIGTGGVSLPEPITFGLSLPGTAVITASTDASGIADGTAQNNPLGSLVGGSALGDYTLTMNSTDNPQFVKDGRFDLSPIVNIVLILGYSFTPKGPSNAITAPSGTWEQLFPSASVFQPLDRGGHSAVYDPVTNRMIVFGGSKFEELPLLNDVEVLTSANGSPDDSQWITLMQPGIADAPSARANHTTVYDAQNNRMILFAGATGVNTFVSDVWVLSNANGVSGTPVWTQLSPAGVSPTPRAGHTAAYDPVNNRMIVFGGSNITEAFSDVWVLVNANGLGGQPQWIRLTPAGGPPPGVSSHTGVYDPAANTLTIFGGFTSFETGQVANAVWNLTGANGLNSGLAWTALFPMGALPAPRAGHTAVYDATGNRMLVFGGGDGSGTVFFDDTWALSNSSGTGNSPSWVRLNSSSKPPIARFFHAAMFDNVNRRMVIYGGSNNEGSFFSVWILKDLQ
jgi:hypothetical protein